MLAPARQNESLRARFHVVRRATEALCKPLSTEDFVVQSMPDVSPTKWHIAHVTWFFETFVLKPSCPGYQQFDPAYEYLFNSYYNAVGPQFSRAERGLLSRPGVETLFEYRNHVTEAMDRFLADEQQPAVLELIELGLHHEQQHQELLLMDIQHVLSINPLDPAYVPLKTGQVSSVNDGQTAWTRVPGGTYQIGHSDPGAFAFDNEGPAHDVLIRPFRLADRPVSNGEYLAFMDDGGYERSDIWLSDGWAQVQEHGWNAPLYWRESAGEWQQFSLRGRVAMELNAPVTHISFYEALAYATWAGARLPSEFEWEVAARTQEVSNDGNFVESGKLRPVPHASAGLSQMFGDVWEWTASAYAPYPGFAPPPGAVGEYNGKFMCNQMVLRGGCALTPRSHIRVSYRNFFYPHMRWQMGGLRLAHDD